MKVKTLKQYVWTTSIGIGVSGIMFLTFMAIQLNRGNLDAAIFLLVPTILLLNGCYTIIIIYSFYKRAVKER